MPSLWSHGLDTANRFARATIHKGGKLARSAYHNRDLIAKGAGIASVVGAGALTGGLAGAVLAGSSQAGEFAELKNDIRKRKSGLTKTGMVNPDDFKKIKDSAKKTFKSMPSKPKIENSRLQQIKQLMQGQQL